MDEFKKLLLLRTQYGLSQLSGDNLTAREKAVHKILLEIEADLLNSDDSKPPNWELLLQVANLLARISDYFD